MSFCRMPVAFILSLALLLPGGFRPVSLAIVWPEHFNIFRLRVVGGDLLVKMRGGGKGCMYSKILKIFIH